ncbi:MAG TPA: FKBP-type peptidyl-prolyl cis-trans isomerase [Puia sp.]|nr:FKBP-type peptidyl-prolyl cis-trans isomerase [Puia sp.]
MRKIVLLCLCICVSLAWFSCFKKDSGCNYQTDNTVATSSEQSVLKKYLDSLGISAMLDSNGFYYQVITKGSGTIPGVCSRVMVSYTGQLTNGYVFDQQTDALFTLGGLIPGWKQGLPLISKGGEIKLYLPPSFGYAGVPQTDKSGNVIIPAYSILIFDINLIDVQ